MKRKFLYLIIMFILAFNRIALGQQDAQFSQYMFNGLYINPAYAGYKDQMNLHTFYRSQWTGFPGAPKTMSLSADAPMMLYNMGLGLQISNDKVGIENSLSVYGIYSYRLKINDEARLSFGLGAGFINNSIDGTNSITDDEGDQLQPGIKSSAFTPDIKFGAFYNDERFYIGASATNLLSPYMVYSAEEARIIPKRSPHIYITSGGLVDVSDNVKLKPSFLLKQELKGISTLDLNMFVLLNDKVWIGTSYRSGLNLFKSETKNTTFGSNSISLLSEVYLAEQFRIGYAFDFPLNSLQGLNYGSHELSLGYTMDVSNVLGNTYRNRPSRVKVTRERPVKTPKEPKPKEVKQAEPSKLREVEKPKEVKKTEPTKPKEVEKPKEIKPAPVKQPVKEDNSAIEAKAKEKQAAIEAKAAEKAQRDREKAEAKEQGEREKAEAKEQREREKAEARARELEKVQKDREEAENKAKAEAEAEAAKLREKEEKRKAEEKPKIKEEVSKEKQEAKAKAEAEERARKLRRKKGAMVSPRYF